MRSLVQMLEGSGISEPPCPRSVSPDVPLPCAEPFHHPSVSSSSHDPVPIGRLVLSLEAAGDPLAEFEEVEFWIHGPNLRSRYDRIEQAFGSCAWNYSSTWST
jgi:hypothetical protein